MPTEPRRIFPLKLTPAERAELEDYASRQGYRYLAEMMRSKLLQLARQDSPRQAA